MLELHSGARSLDPIFGFFIGGEGETSPPFLSLSLCAMEARKKSQVISRLKAIFSTSFFGQTTSSSSSSPPSATKATKDPMKRDGCEAKSPENDLICKFSRLSSLLAHFKCFFSLEISRETGLKSNCSPRDDITLAQNKSRAKNAFNIIVAAIRVEL